MQGPEIRTGFLKDPDKPLKLTAGKEITITTDYDHKGDEEMISCRWADHYDSPTPDACTAKCASAKARQPDHQGLSTSAFMSTPSAWEGEGPYSCTQRHICMLMDKLPLMSRTALRIF